MSPFDQLSSAITIAHTAGLLYPLPLGYNASLISHVNRRALNVYDSFQDISRTIWQTPWNGSLVHDIRWQEVLQHIRSTPFVAFSENFLDIVGKEPKMEKIIDLDMHIHEAPSYLPDTNQLFFTEWGELHPGGFAQHNWQYWVDVGSLHARPEQMKIHNITLDAPIQNVHGSHVRDGVLYVVTDGGNRTNPSLWAVNPTTKESKLLVNSFYGHPFNGFNDVAVHPKTGSVFFSDTSTSYDHGVNDVKPGNPGYTWMLDQRSGEVRAVGNTLSKGNGITVSPDGQWIVVSDTGATNVGGFRDSLGPRSLTKYKLSNDGKVTEGHVLATPNAGLYDGLHFSRNGKYLLAASYQGLDFLDPDNGSLLGTVQTINPEDVMVNFALRPGGCVYIVGKGGVYRMIVDEELAW